MDVKIYKDPNPAIGAALTSARMRSIVYEIAEVAQALYRDQVTKRTGRLAASAHASSEFAEVLKGQPRWVGVLTVGGAGPLGTADYAASHEFGIDREVQGPQRESAPDPDAVVITGGHHGAHDLNRVLEQLGSW